MKINDDFSIERKYQRAHSLNRKHMWKIIEEKGLVDQALELEKHMKRKVGSGRVSRKSVELLSLKQMKQIIFQVFRNLKVLWENQKLFHIQQWKSLGE